MLKDLPNILTVSRVLMIPILVGAFYLDGKLSNIIAAIIFIFASITDYLDGMLARVLKAHSKFGKVLDPIADKLLVASSLVMLIHMQIAPLIPTLLILCREILVSGLREHLAEFNINLPVSKLAKWKTAMQMIAIIILILGIPVLKFPIIIFTGMAALWIASLLTLFTGYTYCKEGFKRM